jgi:hypothetical protein
MTLDTYADLFEDDLDAVSKRLDSMRSNAIGGSWGFGANETEKAPRSQWIREPRRVRPEGFEPPTF